MVSYHTIPYHTIQCVLSSFTENLILPLLALSLSVDGMYNTIAHHLESRILHPSLTDTATADNSSKPSTGAGHSFIIFPQQKK
jgi:hypothetical protein